MQTIRPQFHNLTSSKAKLLATITAVILAIMAIPVILPHITDKSTIYQLASVMIAIFLGVVSILAYMRNRRSRLLFMTFAFFSLSVIEAMYLFDVSSKMEDSRCRYRIITCYFFDGSYIVWYRYFQG